MSKLLAEQIFQKEKHFLLRGLISAQKPIAIILGGQPASGKSNLATIAKRNYPNTKFLIVNGDIYREFHPEYESLKQFPSKFSSETQMFSNVFTEGLIAEAIKNKFNIIVEGTMRNPQIPLQTALKFKSKGFSVEAFAISAPEKFTELGLYSRYQEEINNQGWGRLAEVDSHNSAVYGLPLSLDLLQKEKAVDSIHLYSYQAKEYIDSFSLINDSWNNNSLPSIIIENTRQKQLQDKNQLEIIIEKGNTAYKEIDPNLKGNIDKILLELESILEDLNRENKRGFRR